MNYREHGSRGRSEQPRSECEARSPETAAGVGHGGAVRPGAELGLHIVGDLFSFLPPENAICVHRKKKLEKQELEKNHKRPHYSKESHIVI